MAFKEPRPQSIGRSVYVVILLFWQFQEMGNPAPESSCLLLLHTLLRIYKDIYTEKNAMMPSEIA